MPKIIDETGHIYGRLTVIRRASKNEQPNNKGCYWVCQCICGNQKIVRGTNLREGLIQSCGCLRAEKARATRLKSCEDIINKRFGRLIVIRQCESQKENNYWNKTKYYCQCDCGNTTIVRRDFLISGATKSCGCLASKGVIQLQKILDENNILYQKEYYFNDLIDKKPLRFDFAIFNQQHVLQCLIEFQGSQHYDSNSPYWSETLQNHDQLKKNYCQIKKIPLYYINYKPQNDIQVELNDIIIFPEINKLLKEES